MFRQKFGWQELDAYGNLATSSKDLALQKLDNKIKMIQAEVDRLNAIQTKNSNLISQLAQQLVDLIDILKRR